VPNNTGSWINLSPCELDEFGVARAQVQLVATGADNAVWETMDQAALALVQEVAGSLSNIEYFYNPGWQSVPPTPETIRIQMREGLGTTHHESGTLWMGVPGSSVTNENGRFHHVRNAYVADRRVISDRGLSESSPRWPDTGRPQGGGGDRVERRTRQPAWGSNP
jgi:GMC oxidoreductase